MNNIGAACASFDDLREAEQWFTKSAATAPHPISFQNLFGAYRERGDLNACRRLVNRWLEALPNDPTAEMLSATTHAEMGNPERGVRELRQLIESNRATARAYSVLGWLLSDRLRDLDGALEVLSIGVDRFPDDPAIINNLAYVHLMRGEPQRARRVLEKLNAPHDGDLIYLTATWGLLKLWEGDVDGAIEQYSSAAAAATKRGRSRIAQRVRQKMHLELARYYLRLGLRDRATGEIVRGLAIRGDREYQDDLKGLQGLLTN
jgi:Flp pilus assembly protein TadD